MLYNGLSNRSHWVCASDALHKVLGDHRMCVML